MAEQMIQHKEGEKVATQAIPTGFKWTEIGIIPGDWIIEKLGMYASFRTGPFGSALHKSDYVIDGIPIVNPMQIIDGGIIPTSSMSISKTAATKLSEFRLQTGDIVIGRRGEMGRCAVVGIEENGWLCGTGSMIIRIKSSCESRFIQRVLSSKEIIAAIESSSVGTTMINLNQSTLRELKIFIPSNKNEQFAIATVLSDTDALISGLEQLIAKKQAIKTAAMQQLLTGRTRLPQFALRPDGTPKGYKTSELGQIPEDWDVVCAGDFGKFRGGNGFPVIEQGKLNGEYPFYKVSDMNNEGNGVYMSVSNNWISKEDQSRIGSFVFPSGCIVFAKVGAAVFLERKKMLSMPSCIDNNMAALELNRAKCDVNFVYHFLQSIRFGDFVSTTALPSLNASVLSKIKIIMPLIKEQTAIATILSDMDNELQALTQKLEKARALKQGMMQQLLTGRIRLPLEVGA